MSDALSTREQSAAKRRAVARALLLTAALTASAASKAHASMLLIVPDCSLSGNPLNCRLMGFLNFLYAIAGVLAFVLVVVAALAVKSYRKVNKTKGRP